ncbi:MAG: PD-(D/E)XK nuclease-like domain-containing protein [Planctomycetota bacterium]|jgi:hypothetical protein
MREVLSLLKNDTEYYSGVGKNYLSNSDIGTLLTNPKQFGVSREDNKNFAVGRYFHQLLLEPNKASNVITVDVASRNTKAYKEALEASSESVLLLSKEAESTQQLTETMMSNIHFYDLIRDEGNQYEVPAVGEIMGHQWKGKADIVGADVLVDLKTTSDIDGFRWSAKKYNYDSQCYVYQALFGKPLIFLVIDKTSGMLGEFIPTEDFIKGGADKVSRAIEVYEKFFHEPTKTDDIDSFYISENL